MQEQTLRRHIETLGVSVGPSIDELLTPRQAAEYLGLAEATLQRQRTDGTGPQFLKLGKRKIAYRPRDLTAWIEGRVAQSTADARVRGLTA
jgi:predicted DNA-binding transcriptional regulator AlpA